MLIKGDLYLKENFKNVLENGCLDENPRPRYESDGEVAYTKFITQVFEKYDLSKGEYPFSLARKIAVKTGIKEILAIYQGQQNSRESFEKYGIKWWEPWFNKKGTLGRAYPYNLESHRPDDSIRNYVEVDRRIVDIKECTIPITTTEIDDTITLYTNEELEVLKKIWNDIIFHEVLNDNSKKLIHKSWGTFKDFLLDLPYIPQFQLARENGFKDYFLTTVYYDSNCWGKDTCVFLERKEIEEYVAYDKEHKNSQKLRRKELSRNQVVELINGLKKDPFGRRHITSFWNWANIDKKTLVECAYETIWSCRRGKDGEMYVDMTLIQR